MVGPLVILIVVFGAIVYAMRDLPTTAPRTRSSSMLSVTRRYTIHYPEQGITTTDDSHLPVGRPIALRLTSSDVIYSFWVPALAGKQDMLPDRTNTLVLQADQPGVHGACPPSSAACTMRTCA